MMPAGLQDYADYVRDIPMNIGRAFYPRDEVRLPNLPMPRLPACMSFQYELTTEQRAREQYDKRNEKPVPPPSTSQDRKSFVEDISKRSTFDEITNDVLTPSKPSPAVRTIKAVAQATNSISFEEFEGKASVFDELEMLSFDDRKALSQVLCGTPFASTEANKLSTNGKSEIAPVSQKPSALPSYPNISIGAAKENVSISKNSVAYTTDTPIAASSKPIVSSVTNGSTSSAVSGSAQLRTRLLTKGYRENLVTVAMAQLPKDRRVHIEYYMKGMSMLEKRGVDPKAALTFLMDSGVTDKQEVIQRAQSAEQLLFMGFDSTKVFSAVLATSGDKVKALDVVLAA